MSSSSSLYGFKANVTVSANNLTTLYNAQPGEVVVADVPDRNFTTLYSSTPVQITPTKPYGNANVEAFLNAGTDGANSVQNIQMTGNITVGGSSYLGNVGNVHIDGGNSGYVLTTNGVGDLIWAAPSGGGNATFVEYIHFDVVSTGTNQQFTDGNLVAFANANVMSVFKNGVNIEPTQYQRIGDDILQIDIQLHTGDTIDVLPSSLGGGGGTPGGAPNTVQYNNGYELAGSNSFTFDNSTSTLSVSNINVTTNASLGDVANVNITGGQPGYVLSTDGAGNLVWIGAIADSNYAHFSNYANFAGTAYNVSASNITGIVANANYASFAGEAFSVTGSNVSGAVAFATTANSVAGANVSGYVANATHATISNSANNVSGSNVIGYVANATHAVVSDSANSVSVANVVGIGNIATVNLTGSSSNVLYGNGVFAASPSVAAAGSNTQIQYNNSGAFGASANLTYNSTSDLVSLTNITVGGDLTVQRAYEKYTTNVSGASGTINYDVLTQSILYYTGNATSDCTINVRGNNTTSLNSVMPVGDTLTIVFLNTVGTSTYIANQLQIDGSNVTPKYTNGAGPTVGTRLANAVQSYTYTILKTGSNAYTVLAGLTEYQ